MTHILRTRITAALGALAATASLGGFAAAPASAAPKDTIKPAVTFQTPSAGKVAQGKVTSTVKATDNTKVTKAQLYVAGKLSGTRTSAPWTLTADLAKRTGKVALTWKVSDAAGNVTTVTRTVTVEPVYTIQPVRPITPAPAVTTPGFPVPEVTVTTPVIKPTR